MNSGGRIYRPQYNLPMHTATLPCQPMVRRHTAINAWRSGSHRTWDEHAPSSGDDPGAEDGEPLGDR
jgi:hypothetical protein